MAGHVHGGDIYRYDTCIDFSASCNPLGTPKGVKDAIIDSIPSVKNYPEVNCSRLRRDIARAEEVPDSWVICGNGAAELIFSLVLALKPKKALLTAPSFAEYGAALESVGCELAYYFLKEEKEFRLDEGFLERLEPKPDIVFLCNPNNPDGRLIEGGLLARIASICGEKGIFLAVDECFLDFVEDPASHTLKKLLADQKRLFLFKAFTKGYGMAGLRLGYGLSSDQELLAAMSRVTQPWNVSVIAQEAGRAALREREFLEKGRKLVFEEKPFLMEGLSRLGFVVYPTDANYILFKGPASLFQDMVQKGFLIRDCGNYEGLGSGFFRIAVRTHEENSSLLKALDEVMAVSMHRTVFGEEDKAWQGRS
ncbi:MAG: aminotransferase class I/II-fold pyridoxal phosphate-dependent enzyme [Blautia sp.]|nr:aminotransferase class I/II-fold pyridoxal phosphate-dependent enzyme [Blautia sp.]